MPPKTHFSGQNLPLAGLTPQKGFPVSFSLRAKIAQKQQKTPQIDPKTPLKVVKTPHTQIRTCWKYFFRIGRYLGFWALGTYRGANEAKKV